MIINVIIEKKGTRGKKQKNAKIKIKKNSAKIKLKKFLIFI